MKTRFKDWTEEDYKEVGKELSDLIDADMLKRSVKRSVYITGNIQYESDPTSLSNFHAGYWLDGVWNKLAVPQDTTHSHASHIFITSTDVYITGFCISKRITKTGFWKDGEWFTLNTKHKSCIMKSARNIVVAAN